MAGHKYKLAYFDVRALGEPIRWLLAYNNVEFEDYRIEWDYPKWFEETKKLYTSTVGQIPVLTIDGDKELCQSTVISRYLATQFNMVGDTLWEKEREDELVSMIFDLFHAWRMILFETVEAKRPFIKGIVDQKFQLYYAKFESMLGEFEGPFFLGKKVSYVDFWLASFINIWDDPFEQDVKFPIMPWNLPVPDESNMKWGMTKNFPKLKAHKEKVMALPKIAEWIQKRPKTAA